MSTALSHVASLISPDMNIDMIVLCTHEAAVGHQRHQIDLASNNIVAQLIRRFCADDHICNQLVRTAYNDFATTQFLTQICAKPKRMNSLRGCLKLAVVKISGERS
jgi:hypothetical protein